MQKQILYRPTYPIYLHTVTGNKQYIFLGPINYSFFSTTGPQIHKELAELGGLKNISVTLPDWPISDDTVMHLALAEGMSQS